LGNWQDVHHPLISPGLMEKEILERLPPIRIMVGTEDPFHDECWRFTEKLLNIGKDVKLSIFSGASHGGLNFCFKGGIKESLEMVKKASDWMKVLLNLD
jgi:hormone-sensitive lipase